MESENVFFLQLTPNIPKYYIDLAGHFKSIGITLVPVTIFDLKDLLTSQVATVLIMNYSLLTNKNYRIIRKKYLEFMLINKRVELVEFSTFERPVGIQRSEANGYYHYFALPATLRDITLDVKLISRNEKKEQVKWPGGSRTTLPLLK